MNDAVDSYCRKLLKLDAPLAVGDVVYLKSGGPGMTVVSITPTKAICVWFDKSKLRAHSFGLEMLTRIRARPDGKTAGIILIGDLQEDGSEAS